MSHYCSDGALAIYFIHEIDRANISLYSLAVVQIEFLLLERSRLLLQRRLQLELVGGQHFACSLVLWLIGGRKALTQLWQSFGAAVGQKHEMCWFC